MNMTHPRLFAVVSWGAAGTHWLSKVLNAHPQVLCLHSTVTTWSKVCGNPRVDDLRYLEVIRRTGRGYGLAGDCHGISAASIETIRNKWGNRFRSAVVVRHPMPRIASLWSLATKLGFHHYDLDYRFLRSVTPPKLKWVKTEEHLFFVHAARMPNNVITESTVAPTYKMESLTTDQDEVRRLLRHLSGEELDFDPATLEAVFSQKVVSHSGSEAPKDNRAIFESLPDWQQEIFTAVFDPEARVIYESLGYDFSFL